MEGYGKDPHKRSPEENMNFSVINLDKPRGPTSHQVTYWVRKMLGVEKIAHGGTLDPNVSGVLPILLGEARKLMEFFLGSGKEYIAVMELSAKKFPDKSTIEDVFSMFQGEIYQTPPKEAAVKRELRKRSIYQIEIIEIKEPYILFRADVESGTYIRTLCKDMGTIMGCRGTMAELRRIRSGFLYDNDAVNMLDLKDDYIFWKEEKSNTFIKNDLIPVEDLIPEKSMIFIKDSSVDAICHGANLSIAGISKYSTELHKGDMVALMSCKGELVAMGKMLYDADSIEGMKKGFVVDTTRVIMKRGTYPRMWKHGVETE